MTTHDDPSWPGRATTAMPHPGAAGADATGPGPTHGDTRPIPAIPVVPDAASAPRPARDRRLRPAKPFVAAVDRVDRALFALIGLVCLAGGVAVLLAGFGALGAEVADEPVLAPGTRAYAAERAWFWPAVGTTAALVAVGALAWLLAQFRTGRLHRLHSGGTTRAVDVALESAAVADAVREEIEAAEGVRSSAAHLYRTRKRPVLRVFVTVDPDADVGALRRYLEFEVLPRARRATNRPDLAAQVELGLAAGRRPHRAR